MTPITSDQLQNISVKTVEMFLNDKVPLSEGLAKQASAMELNSEQIQRAVEATNSIAFLKIAQLTNDKTIEFPLCKYAEVMRGVALPDPVVDTSAPVGIDDLFGVEKSASVKEEYRAPAIKADMDSYNYLVKAAAQTERQLSELRDRRITIVPEFEKAASLLRKDPEGLSKLARVLEEDEFKTVSGLVYGAPKAYNDTGLYKAADLRLVNNMMALYKEAKEVVNKIQHHEKQDKRCALVKSAMFGFGGKTPDGNVEHVKVPSNPAPMTIGQKVDKGIDTIKNVGSKVGKAGAFLGNAAFDVAMYEPQTKVHPETGVSKDAWTALQRQ